MNNTRKERRAPLSLKVRFKSATVDQFIEQNARDISRGGLFIKSKKPLAVGTLLKFEFQLKDESRLIHGVGRVVWRREEQDAAGEPPGMGIKFIKMDSKSREMVDSILDRRSGDPGTFDQGLESDRKARADTPFFPETTPAAELPKPEDSTQVRHAREFLASALAMAESSAGTVGSPEAHDPAKASSVPGGPAKENEPLRPDADGRVTAPGEPSAGIGPAFDAALTDPSGLAPNHPETNPPSGIPARVQGLFGDASEDGAGAPGSVRPPGARHSDSGAFGIPTDDFSDSDRPTGRPSPDAQSQAAVEAAEAAIASMNATVEDRAQRQSEGVRAHGGAAESPGESPGDADDTTEFSTANTGRPDAAGSGEPLGAFDIPVDHGNTFEDPIDAPPLRSSRPPREDQTVPQELGAPAAAANLPPSKESRGSTGRSLGILLLVAGAIGGVWWVGTQLATPTSPTTPPEDSSPRAVEPERAVTEQAAPVQQTATSQAAVPKAVAEFEVTSTPAGASVQHAGEVLGTTPLTIALPESVEAELTLSLSGYRTETVTVTPAVDQEPISTTLLPLPYQIDVTTIPAGARVTVRGAPPIQSPGIISLPRAPRGEVVLTAVKAGFLRQRVVVPASAFVERVDAMQASATVELPERSPARPVPAAGGRPTPPAQADPSSPEPSAPSSAEPSPAPAPAPDPEPAAPAEPSTPAPVAPSETPAPAPEPPPSSDPAGELPDNPF